MNADDYRPTTWDDVVGQPTDEIQAQIDGRNTPNMLFYGPPGTGKTTVAHLVTRELMGGVSDLMELNASHGRGIDTVRDEIVPATRQGTLTAAPRVIFLDEMEAMTEEAQQALRHPMERGRAVFLLACNDVSGVHDAVRDRCREYHFDSVSDRAIRRKLKGIAEREDIDVSEGQLSSITAFANGSVRSAIQKLLAAPHEQDGDGPTDAQLGGNLENAANEYLNNAQD